MALTEVDVCNRALVRLGAATINSLEDGSDKANTCATVYPSVRDQLLGGHPWRFATGKRQLARLVDTPVNEWEYAYQLPTDLLAGPYAVFNSTDTDRAPITDWEIFEDKLYCDEDVIVIDYRYQVAEGSWPVWFTPLVEMALAGAIAKAVTDDEDLAKLWHEAAFGTASENMRGGYHAVAARINSRTNPNQALRSDEIVDMRFSG